MRHGMAARRPAPPVTAPSRGPSAVPAWRRRLAIVGAVVAAFAVGAGWQYLQARRVAERLEETDRGLAFTRHEATLAAAALHAQRGSPEVARRLASEFFTGLQGDVRRAPDGTRDALRRILGQRDAVITMLSRGDAESGNVLTQLFEQYRTSWRGPAAAPPMPAPAGRL